jgi:hypothetical protein
MSEKKRELTEREKVFCREVIKDFNGTKAYMRLPGFKGTPESAANGAWRMMRKDEICEYIKTLTGKLSIKAEITVEWVLKELKEQYELIKNSPKYSQSIDRKLEMFGKYLGIWIDKLERKGTGDTLIVINDNSGLIKQARGQFPVLSREETEGVSRL